MSLNANQLRTRIGRAEELGEDWGYVVKDTEEIPLGGYPFARADVPDLPDADAIFDEEPRPEGSQRELLISVVVEVAAAHLADLLESDARAESGDPQ